MDFINKIKSSFSKSPTNVTTGVPSVPVSSGYSTGIIILILISILFILFVSILIIMRLKKTNRIKKSFLNNPVQPSKEIIQFVSSENELPEFNNGKEFAYSFWVYVDELNDISNHNVIFVQSPASSLEDINFKNNNMIVYLEKNTNKLKFKIRTELANKNNVSIDLASSASRSNIDQSEKKGIDGKLNINGENSDIIFNNDTCYYSEFAIDYLPLQVWVNIVINIDNNFVTIYLNGDILITRNLSTNDTKCNDSLANIISTKSGNIFVGSDLTNNLISFDGYLSKFTVFNSSVSIDDIKNIYSEGPYKESSLNKLGVPLYGLRNPLYRIDEIKTTN
jgi:hypothetical protein